MTVPTNGHWSAGLTRHRMHTCRCNLNRPSLRSEGFWSAAGRPGSVGQHAPASRGWLCLPLAGESSGEPLPARPSAYPGGPGARPPTLASRGEAALYRRAAQEQPRYTQHVPSQAGQGREAGEAAGAPRPWGPAPAAPAPAPSQPQQPPKLPGGDTRQATVHFCCHYRAEYGQRLCLVGSHANLGSWVLANGPEMDWTPGDLWRVDLPLPAGGVYEYKYVLVAGGPGSRHALAWQRGNNSVLALGATETEAEVVDNWEGAPGAVVVVAGRAATREGRLLAWANEMEATIASQRSELRAARMELAAMQEEVAQARQARADLAQLQALRKQESAALAEAQASNQSLRTQLVEATSAFHHALSIAQTLLIEAEELTGLAEEDENDEHAWTEDDAQADIEPDPPGAVLDARPAVAAADVTEHAAELGASSPS